MIYITGDKHGSFNDVLDFCYKYNTTRDDILIILGDSGINYFANEKDYITKNSLLQIPITFFCVHGNHEERPENIKTYKTKLFHNGIVYYEEDYPNILFAKDLEIYNFNDKKVLVFGGAYSVDKYFRLTYGYNWYPSELPSIEERNKLIKLVKKLKNIDIILTHTCPYKYIPREMFLSSIDQSTVDNSLEELFDVVEENINYNIWYAGHYHTDKKIDKIRFMYNDIDKL